jgi:hypothetical protein
MSGGKPVKKKFKKGLLLVLTFTLLFTFGVKPKKAEAFVVTAGTAIGLGALATMVLGGVVANEYVTERFGQTILDLWLQKGNLREELINEAGQYIISQQAKQTIAEAVDNMPSQVLSPGLSQAVPLGDYSTANIRTTHINIYPVDTFITVANNFETYSNFEFTISAEQSVLLKGKTVHINFYYDDTFVQESKTIVSGQTKYLATPTFRHSVLGTGIRVKLDRIRFSASDYSTNAFAFDIYNTMLYPKNYTIPADAYVPVASQFETVGDSVSERVTTINRYVADNTAVTVNEELDLLNANISDLTRLTNLTLNEEQEQTGMIYTIAAYINALPLKIRDEMSNLWEDAGAIWTGMQETLLSVNTSINSWVNTSWQDFRLDFDNLNAMLAGLGATIALKIGEMDLWTDLGAIWDGIDLKMDSITNWFDDVLTGTLEGISQAIDDLLNWLNTILGGLLGNIKLTLDSIGEGLNSVGEKIKNLGFTLTDAIKLALTYSFSLPEGWLANEMGQLQGMLLAKFPNLPSIDEMVNYEGDMNQFNGFKANFNQYGVGVLTVVDQRVPNVMAEQVKLFIGGMFYFMVGLFFISKMYKFMDD